ncbi:TonB-dependent receptor plug domain-containing protein [Ideonella azotifigens]|uniref:TonB-dependent receptor n=1 Tax=Ideonella azotifigens TaxID=513160 RepID=A0ABN1JVH6_9BURK|nr:TonB-dependent receptor plug domain-containing protein [Ideonella azotifigens]MCD2343261.1 TonB-dependent receptor plug domain-containing protein [Ideonella azotifigens]
MPHRSTAFAAPHLALTTLAATLMSLGAQAQTAGDAPAVTPPPTPEQVVVTATRGGKAVEKIPGAVSVIGRSEIEAQGLVSEDPSALLAVQVPGYAPSRQKLSNFGEGLRGRNALLLLDGIPQTNPLRLGGREGYFADPMIVQRIEVVSGASAVQGMGATGGIVNTITRTPQTPGTHQTVELKYSTQGHSNSQGWKAGYMLEHLSEGENPYDVLLYLGKREQDIGVDGDGRYLATESLHEARDAYLKLGQQVGTQRFQLMLNQFHADGFDDWVDVDGDRATGLPTSAQHGTLDWQAPRNQVRSTSLEWSDSDLAGGVASVQLFKQTFSARYTGGVITTFQDASLAPTGTLVDQSQIDADKWGLRSSWVRPDFGLHGLEFTGGVDLLHDTSSQTLTMTGRTWVPPLKYRSLAPFTQLEYTWNDLTLRAGLRHENSHLNVDSYTTLAFYGNREVQGGTRDSAKLVKSLGGVWRFGDSGWSSFVSYNEGFGMPDVGLILRAIKTAGQSVDSLVDLQPIVTYNRELGLAWRGAGASFSASVYDSRSSLGSQLVVSNGIGTVQRVPIQVKGFEFSGQWRVLPTLKLDASYALTRGRTAAAAGQPLDLDLGARSQGPDKLVMAGQWDFAPDWSSRLTVSHFRPRNANEDKLSGTTSLAEHFSGYTVLDLATSWHSRWGDLGLGVENLLNRQYFTYYGQANYSGGNDDYYAGRGRTFTVSWKRQF